MSAVRRRIYASSTLRPSLIPVFVRPSTVEDVQAFNEIQHACYPSFLHEEEDVFSDIIEQGCSFAAENDEGRTIGYALVHPIKDANSPPCLNTTATNQINSGFDGHVFIHDVAVHVRHGTELPYLVPYLSPEFSPPIGVLRMQPTWCAKGVGSSLVATVLQMARRAQSISLISVMGSRHFWKHNDFVPAPHIEGIDLSSYGTEALHMEHVRALSPGEDERTEEACLKTFGAAFASDPSTGSAFYVGSQQADAGDVKAGGRWEEFWRLLVTESLSLATSNGQQVLFSVRAGESSAICTLWNGANDKTRSPSEAATAERGSSYLRLLTASGSECFSVCHSTDGLWWVNFLQVS